MDVLDTFSIYMLKGEEDSEEIIDWGPPQNEKPSVWWCAGGSLDEL